MEQICKQKIVVALAAVMAFCAAMPVHGFDLASQPALIENHKLNVKKERSCLAEMTFWTGETNATAEEAKGFNKVKVQLQSKLKVINSYLLLAEAAIGLTTDAVTLTTETANYLKQSAEAVAAKPWMSWYFAETVTKLKKEVERSSKMLVHLGITSMNLARASNDQRTRLIFFIKDTVRRCLSIIRSGQCMMGIRFGQPLNLTLVKDVVSSELGKEIGKKLEEEWNKHTRKGSQ